MKRARWRRRLAWGLGGLLALLVLLVAGALLFATSRPGEAWLLRQGLGIAGEQLAGRLEVGSLDVGLGQVTLTDLKLYTPEGELVAEVARVQARARLSRLLRNSVDLTSVTLDTPRLYLAQDERGLNLSRAVAPRHPKPEEPPSPTPSRLRLSLSALQLTHAYVDFQQELPDGGQRQARLEDFSATGSGSYALANQAFTVTLDATGALSRPTAGPVKLTVKGSGQQDARAVDLQLALAGLELDAAAKQSGPKTLGLELRRLTVAPALAQGLLSSWPLVVPVTLHGTAGLDGDTVTAKLAASAAKATVDVDGDFDLERLRSSGLTVKVRDVNLAELMDEGIATHLSADLVAKGGGTSLESLDGDAALTVSPSEYRGQAVGPVEVRASAKDGRYQLAKLRVLVPGASLVASGEGTTKSLRATGTLQATNLEQLSRALNRLVPGGVVPPLAGGGALDLRLDGPPRTPHLKADGDFAALTYGDFAMKGLRLHVDIPNVTRPLTTDANLAVAELRTGGRAFRDLSAVIATENQNLEAHINLAGDAQFALGLRGQVDSGGDGLDVRTLSLSWPEATWTLRHPTHVRFGGGRVAVEPPLALASESQSLSVGMTKVGSRLDARVELGAVDLAKLPRLFVPESLGLGGTVTGHVATRGVLSRPDAEVDLAWKDGRARGYENLALGLRGRTSGDRATGTLSAGLPAAHATADFDIPIQGLLRRRREPVSLRINLEDVDIAGAMALVHRPEPEPDAPPTPSPTGHLAGLLEVTGTAKDPRVALTLRGRELRYTGRPEELFARPLSFELRAGSDPEDQTLDARLDVQGLSPQTYAVLRTPFTLNGLLAHPPTAAQALDTPVQLEARLADLSLALLQGMPGVEAPSGTVSVQVAASGSLVTPVGRVDVLAKNATLNGAPPLDGQLAIVASTEDVKLTLNAQRQQEALAELTLLLKAPLAALQDRDVFGHVPFELKGHAGPVPLHELHPHPAGEGRGLQGLLALEMLAHGTLEAPQVDLTATVQKLGVGSLALGQARAHYTYASQRSTVDAMFSGASGGTLQLNGGLTLDLSLPALQAASLPVASAPLEMNLRANDFDPSFLSGASQTVRTLGGILQAQARLGGTVGAPTFQGTLQWTDGKLGLMGFGEYRGIQLDLDATRENIQLKRLSAQAGNGTLDLSAQAKRAQGDEYSLEGKGTTKNFPIVVDDQLLALLSMNMTMRGTLSDQLVHLTDLSIPEAHVELPEIKRKDLQSLDRPTDVVLVRNGVPVERRKRKAATPPPAPGTATGTAPPEGAPSTPEPEPARRAYWVNVHAPRNIWVKGSDLNLQLGLSDDFRLEYTDEARMFGEVTVIFGRVDVLGRRFDVQKDSQVRFTGPALAPYINVTAEHRNDSAQVTVFVTIRGQGKDITLKTSSEPPLPESEIYTLLATGRRTLERNSGASMTAGAQAASVVGSYIANQARKTLASKLPLDVLSIEAGGAGLAGTKLEVGTYVTDKIYVGYTGRVGANLQQGENANAVRFEYQFGPRWSVEGQYGDARHGGLDLIWTNEY
ncbi:translocation/assembly module TamB [Corallococcus sp. H22C18031201]|nr:translocation/assembly module TamB [Corallococcus sp. H22C18031201]